jgi:hypothetical protein
MMYLRSQLAKGSRVAVDYTRTYKAWMMPGMYPSKVRTTLIQKSLPHPRAIKTPMGGIKMAKKMLMTSLKDNGQSKIVN